jgi:hypothetical protein
VVVRINMEIYEVLACSKCSSNGAGWRGAEARITFLGVISECCYSNTELSGEGMDKVL